MSFDLNAINIVLMLVFIPVFAVNLVCIINCLKSFVNVVGVSSAVFIPLINIELEKELSVLNYQTYSKCEIWKLYNQY
ncbi:hypothetical protein [Candidatus Contubernalis alkaliaceticus]|uniref:hypothetical protein n=1 Tax=Candidatus Contubernalis alkaliaceticus TaxID=338645 RepID=UPI001F4BF830|nr:hypothetical protein [Candidatus Contubernalis alkalaceticus]UNC91207.1 hypothetical protein HUE98_03345 [Candidatus Contubernalis alkalaceticus]